MDNKTAFHEALFKCLSMFYLYEERSVTALGCSPAANTNLCVHFKTKQLPRLIKTLHLRHFSTIEEQVSHFLTIYCLLWLKILAFKIKHA